jgi:hypothetical protein
MTEEARSAATGSLRKKLWEALGEASVSYCGDKLYLDRLLAKLAEKGLEIRETK